MPVISDTMFQGQMPQLSSLELFSVAISPLSPLFHSNITLLDITSTSIWNTYQDMTDTLRRVPSLQTLRVSLYTPLTGPFAEQTVGLPHLQKLSLFGRISLSVSFRKAISYPPSCTFSVDVTEDINPVSP
ncbi:hypothetical protein OF83DRAFT_1178268 [Amylostereum chailletii]|nr:hypothetical protein OF83DRAFT_1178268 [Amylostereum chailletii]